MKIILSVFTLILTVSSSSFASTPEQEQSFVNQYKQAFEAKDATKLESFLYTKNADPEALEFFKMMLTADMGAKISKIELLNLTADEIKEAAEIQPGMDGGNSKLPLAPTKRLVMTVENKSADGTSTSTSKSYVAESDGKLVIPVPVAVK